MKPKICFVATIPAVVDSFLRSHIARLSQDFSVTVICNNQNTELLDGINARFIFLPLMRKPSLWKDLVVLFKLIKLFYVERFFIVHSIMPKTGLLAMIAALVARVPFRIHTFTGQIWVTKQGFKRRFFKLIDRVIGAFCSIAIVDSASQKNFLISEGVLAASKALVIGFGSICGVDSERFKPDMAVRYNVREELNIPSESCVILFIGRLNRDKGVLDLASAFLNIARLNKDFRLLLVGSEEDVTFDQIRAICNGYQDRLLYVPYTKTPERYMMTADIFCLPSYREGFGMTIIEAAACGVPTVASRIYGITDAVDEGKTGLLFSAGNVKCLAELLLNLLNSPELRQRLGDASRKRAIELFSLSEITSGLHKIYINLLDS